MWTGFPSGSAVKNFPAVQKTTCNAGDRLWSLVRKIPTHSSVLAWRIPGMGEPGGLPSMGSNRIGHDWSDLAAAAAGRSPERANSNPLQYSCLGNPMVRGTWWATVHGFSRVGHDLEIKPPPGCALLCLVMYVWDAISRWKVCVSFSLVIFAEDIFWWSLMCMLICLLIYEWDTFSSLQMFLLYLEIYVCYIVFNVMSIRLCSIISVWNTWFVLYGMCDNAFSGVCSKSSY